MKKVLAVVLIIVVVISIIAFYGCSPKDEPAVTTTPTAAATPAAATEIAATEIPVSTEELTEEMLKSSKPNEYVQEKLDAGMEPLITFVTPLLTSDFLVSIDTGLKEHFEALGYSYTTANANNDLSQIMNLVENAVQMKSAAVLVLDIGEGLADVCANAEKAGTHIVTFGTPPLYPVAGMVVLDQGEQGKQGAYMAHAWLDLVYPDAADGSIHAYITINTGSLQNINRSEGFKKYLPEDPRITVSFIGTQEKQSSDDGFNLTQDAFTVDPEIHIGLIFNSAACVGANNYIVANVDPTELAKYGLFCNTQDASLFKLIEAGKTNDGSCVRGTIAQGSSEGGWYGSFMCATALLTGGAKYGYILHERIFSVNNFGYEYDSEP